MSEDIRKMIDKVKNFKQFVNEEFLNEFTKIDKLLSAEIDSVKMDDDYAHAELNFEQLKDGEMSIHISEIWSDIRGKGHATKLLNKIKRIAIKKGVPLSLRASTSNNIKTNSGLSQSDLVNWYIKNGFKISEEDNNFETDSTAPFMVFNT